MGEDVVDVLIIFCKINLAFCTKLMQFSPLKVSGNGKIKIKTQKIMYMYYNCYFSHSSYISC